MHFHHSHDPEIQLRPHVDTGMRQLLHFIRHST